MEWITQLLFVLVLSEKIISFVQAGFHAYSSLFLFYVNNFMLYTWLNDKYKWFLVLFSVIKVRNKLNCFFSKICRYSWRCIDCDWEMLNVVFDSLLWSVTSISFLTSYFFIQIILMKIRVVFLCSKISLQGKLASDIDMNEFIVHVYPIQNEEFL